LLFNVYYTTNGSFHNVELFHQSVYFSPHISPLTHLAKVSVSLPQILATRPGMLDKVKEIHQDIDQFQVNNKEQLEQFRLKFISRKGVVTELFEALKTVPQEDRRAVGQELNGLKNKAQERFQVFTQALENQQADNQGPAQDLTLPVFPNLTGTQHPISLVRQRIIQIFERIGFTVSDGPEIETDWYNFGALNFPDNHPARDMQDTFFYLRRKAKALTPICCFVRTHRMFQIRLMEHNEATNSINYAGTGVFATRQSRPGRHCMIPSGRRALY